MFAPCAIQLPCLPFPGATTKSQSEFRGGWIHRVAPLASTLLPPPARPQVSSRAAVGGCPFACTSGTPSCPDGYDQPFGQLVARLERGPGRGEICGARLGAAADSVISLSSDPTEARGPARAPRARGRVRRSRSRCRLIAAYRLRCPSRSGFRGDARRAVDTRY